MKRGYAQHMILDPQFLRQVRSVLRGGPVAGKENPDFIIVPHTRADGYKFIFNATERGTRNRVYGQSVIGLRDGKLVRFQVFEAGKEGPAQPMYAPNPEFHTHLRRLSGEQ